MDAPISRARSGIRPTVTESQQTAQSAGRTAVLLVGSFAGDPVNALRSQGVSLMHVDRIADIERWPVGAIVVTDPAHYGLVWRDVGAARVVILGDGPVAGDPRGADAWLRGTGAVAALTQLVAAFQTQRMKVAVA